MSDLQTFPCPKCGSELEFDPEKQLKECVHCGYEEEIEEQAELKIEELDFHQQLTDLEGGAETVDVLTASCECCGAKTQLEENVTSGECAFCGSNINVSNQSEKQIKPKSLLPFSVKRETAQESFQTWIKGLWFAPSKLSDLARSKANSLVGSYLPHWTYDTNVSTYYTGKRGEDYYVTESYTDSEGKRKTRQVKKTRWYSVSGRVHDDFDDVLVVAGSSLPKDYIKELEPWDLQELVPYTDDYISGFRTESYSQSLEDGFIEAKEIMEPEIKRTICRDIGGDHQRIHSMSCDYQNITFKHILLPVWLNSYMYDNLVYRFVVNARTGEVQGERPRSWGKFIAAVLAVIVVAAIAAVVSLQVLNVPLLAGLSAISGLGVIGFFTFKLMEGHTRREE